MLERLLGGLGPIGDGDHGPVVPDLVDTKAVKFALCNYKGLTLTPKLLPKQGVILVLSCPPEVFVCVAAFKRNQLACL
jgi:hypothetical protein